MKKTVLVFVLAFVCNLPSLMSQTPYRIRLNNGTAVTGRIIGYKQDSICKIILTNNDTLVVNASSIVEFSLAAPLFTKRTNYREKGVTRFYFAAELSSNLDVSGAEKPSHGYGALVSAGAFVNGMTMAGFGTGIESYVNYSGIVPVFLEIRQSLLPTKVAPTLSASGGYFVSVNSYGPGDGYFLNPQIGLKASGKRREWFMFHVGYKYMGLFDGGDGIHYLTCKVGYKF